MDGHAVCGMSECWLGATAACGRSRSHYLAALNRPARLATSSLIRSCGVSGASSWLDEAPVDMAADLGPGRVQDSLQVDGQSATGASDEWVEVRGPELDGADGGDRAPRRKPARGRHPSGGAGRAEGLSEGHNCRRRGAQAHRGAPGELTARVPARRLKLGRRLALGGPGPNPAVKPGCWS